MSDIVPIPAVTTDLARIEEELAKFAQEASDKETLVAGQFLSIRGGVLTLAGQPIKGNAVQCIVLSSIYENTYYDGPFDPDNKAPPACYAFSETQEGLKPHQDAEQPQYAQCDGCPRNAWGSAAKGEGKACQNRRRLALIAASDLSAEAIAKAEVVYFKVPVTSVKFWSMYLKQLATALHRPPFGVVTKITANPDPKFQVRVGFEAVGLVPVDAIPTVMRLADAQKSLIQFPYQKAQAKEEAKASGKF